MKLEYVQLQPWRLRYLTLDELADVCHEAEAVDDDVTVGHISNNIRDRDLEPEFREAYSRAARRWLDSQPPSPLQGTET